MFESVAQFVSASKTTFHNTAAVLRVKRLYVFDEVPNLDFTFSRNISIVHLRCYVQFDSRLGRKFLSLATC
jgi:hypothetical protein